jgi:hypothetical protein
LGLKIRELYEYAQEAMMEGRGDHEVFIEENFIEKKPASMVERNDDGDMIIS